MNLNNLLMEKYPLEKFKKIRFFIGDIRDQDRVISAFNDIDIVIHVVKASHNSRVQSYGMH